MVGNLKNLKLSVLAQSSRKYSSKARTSMCKKSGPSGSDLAKVAAGNNAKMFPTVAALIFVNLDVDAELDDVPTTVLFPTFFFSVMGRSMRRSFLVGKIK